MKVSRWVNARPPSVNRLTARVVVAAAIWVPSAQRAWASPVTVPRGPAGSRVCAVDDGAYPTSPQAKSSPATRKRYCVALSVTLHSVLALVLLVIATILAVYMPRGMTSYGRRRQGGLRQFRRQPTSTSSLL
jgi:hypothetical protein